MAVTYVDKNGTRYNIKQLKTPQTEDAQLGHLRTHYGSHPSSGLTPAKLSELLAAATRGDLIAQCELAEDMEEKDGHIFSELQKRRRALLGVDWNIVPPRNASKAEIADCEMLQQQFEDMLFLDDLIFDMSDAILKGFSNSEIIWQQQQSLWLPSQVEFRDPSWFMTHPAQQQGENRNELRLRDNTANGAPLQPFGWIQHTHKTKSGYQSRNGLARVLAWPFLFKNFSVRDLAEFLEIYGLPLRLGKYPSGANPEEKRTLLNAVMSIGHNAGGIIPKGMEIDFEKAADGDNSPFEYMISLMERTISKAILGGTLTSQADGKSSTNALGNVHNEVRQELRDSDLKQIANTLSRDLVLPMYMLNGKSYRQPQRSPRFVFDLVEPEDIKAFSESLPKLVEVGFAIPQAWAHDKLQIPVAQKDEAVLQMPTPQAAPEQGAKQAPEQAPEQAAPASSSKASDEPAKLKYKAIKHLAALKLQASDEDDIDEMAKQLSTEMSGVIAGFGDEIQALVNSASSLEELQTRLAALDLDVDEASEVLQLALASTELAGQFDVSEGN